MTLKQYRQKHGLSQSQLAKILETSVRNIQNWEQGRVSPDSRYKKVIGKLMDGEK